MSEVTQTILYDPERQAAGVYGNCLQAAVASVLDLPLDAVPHFAQFVWWPQALRLWARGRGLDLAIQATSVVPDRLCLVGGRSERGVDHVCVGDGGKIVWDPHPSRAGLVEIVDVTWFVPWPSPDVVKTCWFCRTEFPPVDKEGTDV